MSERHHQDGSKYAMITPVVLTHNEEPNIERTLACLVSFPRVVVLDSGSTDRTEEISRSFVNVSWHVRNFDTHRDQWHFAIFSTGIDTEYVLALDADMRISAEFGIELSTFLDSRCFQGAWVPFEYRVLRRKLFGSIYPPQVRIFRPQALRIEQPGHTQVFEVDEPLYRFRARIVHEDKKPLDRWMASQLRYAGLEAGRIRGAERLTFKDRLRISGLSPAIWGAYAYIRAGGPLNPIAARAYAYERLTFEAVLARLLCEEPSSQE